MFSERVVARIIRDRDPQLRVYCDKLQCKAWIDSQLGPGFQPLTLAVVEDAEALRGLDLPSRWILKASHGSGWTRRIGPDDQPLQAELIAQANDWLQRDYTEVNREWAYGDLQRRLIAEEWLLDNGATAPEISVFCFAGRTPLIRLHLARSITPTADPASWPLECFLDGQARLLPIERPRRHHDPSLQARCWDALPRFLELARTLTGQQEFLRIDGYLCADGLRLGEITPYPYAGLGFDLDPCWDAWLGSFWD
ncbi:ATP-grasp fold amidoligase family protein [Synechococcus sp. CBW1004]|uniref:ATP-grasp fold amidoligase family protein n=1 Tax=Synechococcus sp. CBW1004 TaxID=1353136 RepID=UPI001E2AA602|nr:ATP-grasp fold amidoligase family protein [Synechococcus sp. CBW1004]